MWLQMFASQMRWIERSEIPIASAAVASGPGATMMFNAANEAAQRLYLANRMDYYDINEIISD